MLRGVFRFREAMRYLRKVTDPQIATQHIELFISIAIEPGLSQSELIGRTQSSQGAVSRNTKSLKERYGLIEITIDSKTTYIFLSEKGKEVAEALNNIIEGAQTQQEEVHAV